MGHSSVDDDTMFERLIGKVNIYRIRINNLMDKPSGCFIVVDVQMIAVVLKVHTS